jgi:hypothetical protein
MTRRNLLPYLVLGPAVVLTGLGWYRSEQGRREALDRLSKVEKAAIVNSARPSEIPQIPAPLESVPAEAKDRAAVARPPSAKIPGGGPDTATDVRMVEELRARIQALSNDLAGAREEAVRQEAKASAENAEAKKLQAQVEELQQGLQSAKQNADAALADARAKAERLGRIESAEKAAIERAARAEASAARNSTQSKELEDLIRRREAIVTSLQRRYRDVTDIYRNFTLNAQTRDTSTAGMQAGDLSRIQSAIQQAEDDLRQLQTLNARVAQLTRSK